MEKSQNELTISARWLPPGYRAPEVGSTAAEIQIKVGDAVVTSIDDRWAQTTRPDAPLSAYPLALWLASSWWRLRWEPASFDSRSSTDWKMAHEIAAAGYGFLWPHLRIESDGYHIELVMHPTSPQSSEMIHYLSDFRGSITARSFETAIDRFVAVVLGRLDALRISNSDLRESWSEVLRERQEPELATRRRLEAIAGFEPGELPPAKIDLLTSQETRIGREAIRELAACCRGTDPETFLGKVSDQATSAPSSARVPAITLPTIDYQNEPWNEGRRLAGIVRRAAALGDDALSSSQLSDLFALPKKVFERQPSSRGYSIGLAVRRRDTEKLRISFRSRNAPGRRFEAARLLCDALMMSTNETWLPCTDAKTSRQKIQRAFAAEFLCPLDALVGFTGKDPSREDIENAAEHFEISSMAITSHLVNHEIIPVQRLAEFYRTP